MQTAMKTKFAWQFSVTLGHGRRGGGQGELMGVIVPATERIWRPCVIERQRIY